MVSSDGVMWRDCDCDCDERGRVKKDCKACSGRTSVFAPEQAAKMACRSSLLDTDSRERELSLVMAVNKPVLASGRVDVA